MKKAALHNLGCKVNSYETEAMQEMLANAGYEIVDFSEVADVYVINTCSVTNMADRKSRQMLHRAKKLNPDAVVVGTGCYVQTREEEALADLSIDIVLGNNLKHELVDRINAFYAQKEDYNCIIDINDNRQEYEEMFLSQTAEHTRAFIKVQDGCNQFCSYCIIPYARGRVRSRNIESVIEEVNRLVDNGFKEIVLTGIHLSSYGIDTDDSLLHLIKEVHNVPGVKRIRLGSLEPRLVTEEFADEISKLPKLCPHFHLSLQSGCDETLKRMNRKYSAAEYMEGCNILRKYFNHPAITTDVIVGFPGETEEEFEQSAGFVQDVHFYEMHIFQYSKRKGTRAAVMPQQIPEPLKKERSARLITLGDEMSKEFRDFYIGKEKEVLFEEKSSINGEEYFVGYTKEYVKIALKTDEDLTNKLVTGVISGRLSDEVYIMES